MASITFDQKPQTEPKAWLDRRLSLGITPALVALGAIMLLSAVLHFTNINSFGDANAYYTAAVKSMLQSWHNFFFIAAEPGGSVTVDKPPLGLWIEAAFAYVLGVSGFSVSLPNILAGIFSVPLLYHLVKKYFGTLAGLLAALVIAVTPVVLATDRNNTIDGMLVFTLLLAGWVFIKATESGRLRWLLLGAFIVGLGFNIKMLQAFLPLPAFYALYLFGASHGWWKKLVHLALATLVLVLVSLSWAVAVDLTPADARPYVGSSTDNTVTELIIGHNGLSRLFGPSRDNNPSDNADVRAPGAGGNPQPGLASGRPSAPQGGPQPPANRPQPPNGIQPPDGGLPQGAPNQGGNTPISNETGQPGLLRLFSAPLAKEMSWLLPFALFSVVILLFATPLRLPVINDIHKGLILWGGWLLTCVVFFSMASFFHAYYMIMLAAPLGAVIGGGVGKLWSWQLERRWAAGLLFAAAALTVGFQVWLAGQYYVSAWWLPLAAGILAAGGVILAVKSQWAERLGYGTIVTAMLVIPFAWSYLTVSQTTDVNLPGAFAGANDRGRTGGKNVNTDLIEFLTANTQDMEYMLAVPSAQNGAQIVLATGRPVLYMGGFSGSDPVVNVEDLSQMVADGELKYILFSGDKRGTPEITQWVQLQCSVVPQFSRGATQNAIPQSIQNSPQPGGTGGGTALYQCGG